MLTPKFPRIVNGGVTAAFEAAREGREPVFVPQPLFADDRGWSMMNQLQGVMTPQGQVNYSVQYPGVVKAWHRHSLQTDFWICLQGHIKVGVYREEDRTAWLGVIGEKRPGVMIIPPPLWHGAATVGDTPAGLLYYVTHAYNAASPDEDRRAHDSIEGFPWGVRHG
ncbi:MAG: dTDP-4-dehydrorhamnose 3,5-epimerase family protein [Phycisphaeraceae bacterium]|nr:dTDP-4-dehydrorhamnose 3,5-epimerase family protein [Phycisphaeraceae bacterium]